MRWFLRFLTCVAGTTLACGPPADGDGVDERRREVAEAGAAVMPFDLDRTTHVFEPTERGGVQRVVSDDGDDVQVRLIREHLSEEAERFSRGDFHDPRMIHGPDMAGLHELAAGGERLSIRYSEIERGAQILYTSEDPHLVAAIHRWFEAQLADHGEHARSEP